MPFSLRPLLFGAVVVTFLPAILLYHHVSMRTEDGISVKDTIMGTLSSFSPESPLVGPPDEYLAMCLAVKNQGRDLPEWLHHHYYNMGVGKFYIMDDGSIPPLSDMSDALLSVPREAVEFHYFNASQRVDSMQYKLYNLCAGMGRKRNNTWMAFFDADEFLDAPGKETVRGILEAFEPVRVVGAVGVSWRIHTSGGRLQRADSVLHDYTECIYDDPEHDGTGTDNKHIKSIVRVKDYDRPINPHKFHLKNNAVTVGEYGERLDHFAFRQPITRERLALHHYAIKSRQEYEEKMARGSAMTRNKGWGFWDHIEKDLPHEACPEMLRWANKP
ncbi:Glycosyltranserase family 2 [Pleurostoma richardsiae]|uniref:Glycosyltranserase family 2 n=1 Tax=Pleurostoma richardsiae TaxID=41990 RepID=A0AA38VTM0_9PEZI|nr:Glycosyltranserase family 2 [Pleurostoma richardsiae]